MSPSACLKMCKYTPTQIHTKGELCPPNRGINDLHICTRSNWFSWIVYPTASFLHTQHLLLLPPLLIHLLFLLSLHVLIILTCCLSLHCFSLGHLCVPLLLTLPMTATINLEGVHLCVCMPLCTHLILRQSQWERVCLFAFVYIHIDFPSYVSVNMQLKETDGLMEAVRTFVCRFASVWLCCPWISTV